MLDLKELTVKRYTPNELEIKWAFEATQEDLTDYQVDILQSQAPSETLSDYDTVASGIAADIYTYDDVTVSGLAHGTRKWYYRLKVTNTSTSEIAYVPSGGYAYLNDEVPNYRWSRIYNYKKCALDARSGRDFILLKRRSWGERCDVAWDPILFRTNTEVCADCDCWGTGWREGFFTPQVVTAMLNPTPSIKQITEWGEFYPSDSILTMLNKPPIEIGDVIIDPKTDKRYYAQRVRTLELLGAPIEQQIQLSLIHISDEIYEYNVEAYT